MHEKSFFYYRCKTLKTPASFAHMHIAEIHTEIETNVKKAEWEKVMFIFYAPDLNLNMITMMIL